MNTETKSVMTVAEVGKKLGLSKVATYNLCHSEGFPTIRIGKRILIPVTRFEKWLDTCGGTIQD